ncbi:hypothetical protein HNP84_000507 [Thermocatellispora tengchongensis]|uniref:Uncharacterized protein n=1 Tax=Thermocatellispora tengchongensis TaxID=1073253 RepID=A0A840NVI4_9ACTN|nr:hypothetical protein [Thermocatellispora tengchongensis]MBB5130819.1 hypothetical protein [Thermocatellispora tengchongensis]
MSHDHDHDYDDEHDRHTQGRRDRPLNGHDHPHDGSGRPHSGHGHDVHDGHVHDGSGRDGRDRAGDGRDRYDRGDRDGGGRDRREHDRHEHDRREHDRYRHDSTEAELVRTLARAAEAAPEPIGDLAAMVAARRRTRTRRRAQSALAVAGVVTVIAAGSAVTGVFSNRGGEDHVTAADKSRTTATATVTPTATATSTGSGELTATMSPPPADGADASVPKAAEVWPGAVSTIPAAAGDGWRYRPVDALSPTQILLSAESSFEKAGRLEVYDTAAKRATVLTELPAPEGVKGYFVQRTEVGPGHIAWYGTTPNDDTDWADVWVVPRSGGEPTRLAELTGARSRIDAIGVSEGHVYWSVASGGIYRVPISGGTPEPVAGTEGLHLREYPWASDVSEYGDFDKNQTLLVNVETGERRQIDAVGRTNVRCGSTWCVGTEAGRKAVAWRLDGSGARSVPGTSPFGQGIHLGRFVPLSTTGIYDLATGTQARIGATRDDGGTSLGHGTSSSPSAIFYWEAGTVKTKEVCRTISEREVEQMELPEGAKGPTPGTEECHREEAQKPKEYEVLNLAAVPPAE